MRMYWVRPSFSDIVSRGILQWWLYLISKGARHAKQMWMIGNRIGPNDLPKDVRSSRFRLIPRISVDILTQVLCGRGFSPGTACHCIVDGRRRLGSKKFCVKRNIISKLIGDKSRTHEYYHGSCVAGWVRTCRKKAYLYQCSMSYLSGRNRR